MAKRSDIPLHGPLQGVRVLNTGTSLAAPFCCTLMAELGADVIKVENLKSRDMYRGSNGPNDESSYNFVDACRNERDIALDFTNPAGREILLKMVAEADILVESSKAGSYDKMGLSDETLWEVNPKLVIVHVSGFGQTGDPQTIARPGVDGIALAFSGYTNWNGWPDMPYRPKPFLCDYVTAYYACWNALAALHRAAVTGIGDSVDVAQYEVMLRIQGNLNMEYWNKGILMPRTGNQEPFAAGSGVFKCSDGVDIFMAVLGAPLWSRAIEVLGLSEDPAFANFLETKSAIVINTPAGDKLESALKEFCATHTSVEVKQWLLDNKLTGELIYTPAMMLEDPHYKARENIIKYYDEGRGEDVININILPKYKKNPPKLWRGSVRTGADTNDILEELGYTTEQIAELKALKATK